MAKKNNSTMTKMFWVDLEMTGLDEKRDTILEVAVLVTDLNFTVLDSYHQIVYQTPEVLANMNDWCKVTHGKSGLTEKVPTGMPIDQVEKELIALAQKHFSQERIVLCGNSVGNDRRFIDAYWPEFAKLLHYRLIDVSSFKEVFRAKYQVTFEKKETHRALDDINESIAELKHYLSFVRFSG